MEQRIDAFLNDGVMEEAATVAAIAPPARLRMAAQLAVFHIDPAFHH